MRGRLGANSLVSCIFGGGIAGPAAVKYVRNLERGVTFGQNVIARGVGTLRVGDEVEVLA